MGDEHHYLFDLKKRIVIGESRGAMIAMGLISMDTAFDQEIVFSDITAPCFPRHLEPNDILRLSQHILKEPISTIKSIASLTLRQAIHYPATIDLHPYAIAHQAGMIPALLSGDAGKMAQFIPRDKIIHITCFEDDFASMPEEWRTIFTDHPNVRITVLPGSHLSLANMQTQKYIKSRIEAYHEYSELGLPIDGQQIFDRAHKLIKS
jgi:hypothetical protein